MNLLASPYESCCKAVLKLLALLHSVTANMPNSKSLKEAHSSLPMAYTEDTARLCEIFYTQESLPNLSSSLPGFSFERLCGFLSGSLFGRLLRLPIHGDFRPRNILCSRSSGYSVCDWDLLRYAPRLFDVVDVCSFLAYGPARVTLDWEQFAHCIDIYREESQSVGLALEEDEFSCIPEIHRLVAFVKYFGFSFFMLTGASQAKHLERGWEILQHYANQQVS